MSWVETLQSQQVTKDYNGIRHGMREYRVWGPSRTQILTDPTAILNEAGDPLPGYNTSWEGMLLDRYSVTALGSIFDVTALYSNDRRFAYPPGSPTLADRSWTGSFQTEQVPIPFGIWTNTNVVTLVQGGPPLTQTVYGWEFASQDVDHKFERIGQQVYLSAANIGNAIEAVAMQADKVHKIRGRYYLFEPGDYAEETDGRWRMQYQWTRDPGTPVIDDPEDPWLYDPIALHLPTGPNGVGFEYPAGSDDYYARPPWHKLLLVQEDPDPSAAPKFRVRKLKDHSDLTGWSTLPGFQP